MGTGFCLLRLGPSRRPPPTDGAMDGAQKGQTYGLDDSN